MIKVANCDYCGGTTFIKDTHSYDKYIRRARECKHCYQVSYTYEISSKDFKKNEIQQKSIQIIIDQIDALKEIQNL